MTLEPVFEPRSIAVVGASANPTKRGNQILRALGESGYEGRVYAVNRAGGRLLGHTVYRSVQELPEAADLAVICTPAAAAPDLVRACGERGVAGAVVLAVGFGESGHDGARLEARLRDAARIGGVRIIVGFGEVLEYLGDHADTRVVIAHIEGCRDARAFLRAASTVTPGRGHLARDGRAPGPAGAGNVR